MNNILVFGSLITGEFNQESDVDIAILGNSKFHIKDILRLELFFEDLLEIPIDVVDLKSETLDLFINIDILNITKSTLRMLNVDFVILWVKIHGRQSLNILCIEGNTFAVWYFKS